MSVIIDCLDKINVNCFDKHLRKAFTNVSIVGYLGKLKVDITVRIVEIDIYEYFFIIIIGDTKLIANGE